MVTSGGTFTAPIGDTIISLGTSGDTLSLVTSSGTFTAPVGDTIVSFGLSGTALTLGTSAGNLTADLSPLLTQLQIDVNDLMNELQYQTTRIDDLVDRVTALETWKSGLTTVQIPTTFTITCNSNGTITVTPGGIVTVYQSP